MPDRYPPLPPQFLKWGIWVQEPCRTGMLQYWTQVPMHGALVAACAGRGSWRWCCSWVSARAVAQHQAGGIITPGTLFFAPFAPCAEAKQKGWRLAAAGWRHPLPISTRRAERKLSAPLQIVILDKRLCNNLRNAREDLALIPYKPSLTSGSLKSNLAELTRAANVEPLDSGERQARLKRPRSLRRGAEGCPCLGGAWDFV